MPPTTAPDEKVDLPDGSVATVERQARHAVVSRFVDGVCVWAQAFTTHETDRAAEVLDRMGTEPAGFERPWCTRCGSGAHRTMAHR